MGLKLQNPGGPMAATEVRLASRPDDLRGRRVALLDNGKNNARELLEAVFGLVEAELEPAEVVWRKVPTTLPAPDSLLDGIAAECDLAILAVGD